MRILVTGASGHLGRAVRRRLDAEAANDTVPIYWISPRSKGETDGSVVVDLTDLGAVDRAAREARPDAVLHLAAVTGAACERDAALAALVNVEATRVLAGAAAASGANRFVLASTAAIYGDAHHSPVPEEAVAQLGSEYARSKRAAEIALEELGDKQPSLQSVALRIFNIYGDEFRDSLVARLLRSTADQPVALRGPDNFVRDYVHVDDVVTAIVEAMHRDFAAAFTAINIGTGIATSNRRLTEVLERQHAIYTAVADGPPSYSCADITRARALLDFAPRPLVIA